VRANLAAGITTVSVPQNVHFLQMSAATLHAINPRLHPLFAHDRAGFGGGLGSLLRKIILVEKAIAQYIF